MIGKAKFYYLIFTLIAFLSIIPLSTFAENNIVGLGYTKVEKVKYLGNGIFSFVLRRSEQNNNHPSEILFGRNETVSFTFNADKLNGIVVVTKDLTKGIMREDITLSGKEFVNLLLQKATNNEPLNLTCGVKNQTVAESLEKNPFKLTYFQVNE